MKSRVRNAGTKGSSLDAMVADTMAAMAELAQQNRRAATSGATSTEARDSMPSAELTQQSASAPVATPTAAGGGPPVVWVSDSMRSAELAQQSQRAAAPVATPTAAGGGPPAVSVSDCTRSAALAEQTARAAAPAATQPDPRAS